MTGSADAKPRALRRWLVGVLAVALAAGISGCSTTMSDLPLPGTSVSGDTVTITADFDEALNLATGATVKVNGIDSGKVQEVAANDFQARVTMVVKESAELREGAQARLRYTTPLGELFVDVTNPASGALLEDDGSLAADATSTAPTVEDALSQASLLINGGGLEQLQTVTEELNTAIGGREDTIRSLLQRSTRLLTEVNATTDDIDTALTSLRRVSITLRQRERVINRAVKEVAPAARVLRQNTPGLTKLLAEIEKFSATANQTVDVARDDLLNVLRLAEPVLAEFASAQRIYPASLAALAETGKAIDEMVPGDYLGLSLNLHLDGIRLPDLGELLGLPLPDLNLPNLPLPDIDLPLLPLKQQAKRDRVTLAGLLSEGAK